MADTGAPWNLPYPLPTDLVRDGADAIKDLAEATADGLDAAGGLVAVKHVLKTDAFSSSTTATWLDVTGLTVDITPQSDTNTVYVLVNTNQSATASSGVQFRVLRDSTVLPVSTAGSPEGNSTSNVGILSTVLVDNTAFVVSDVPGVTTQVTYKVQVRSSAGTVFINRRAASAEFGSTSSLTLLEVKV